MGDVHRAILIFSKTSGIDNGRRGCQPFAMPTVCRFYGIVIQMYFTDHGPAHFYVIYNEYKAIVGIHDLSILHGDLPPKAIGMVMEWARIHREELRRDWELAEKKQTPLPIPPLE